MNANKVQMDAIAKIKAYKPNSRKDIKRLNTAIELVKHDLERAMDGKPTDSGLAGKVAEILAQRSASTIARVQKQGAHDGYPVIDGKPTPYEHKRNGGRIESLYRLRKPENAYIAYELDFTPANRTLKDGTIVYGVRRYCYKLLRVSDFLAILEDTGAVKIAKHDGKNDAERAVQCSSKKLYEALMTGGFVDFERNAEYSSDEI